MDILKQARAQRARLRQLRRHRVRVAGQPEIELAEVRGGDMSLPPVSQHYVAVRFLMPSTRFQMLIVGPADADPELMSERAARTIFKHYATELAREIQAGLLEAGPK
jgi:hypothetical protein